MIYQFEQIMHVVLISAFVFPTEDIVPLEQLS